jgi:hypothetical protein
MRICDAAKHRDQNCITVNRVRQGARSTCGFPRASPRGSGLSLDRTAAGRDSARSLRPKLRLSGRSLCPTVRLSGRLSGRSRCSLAPHRCWPSLECQRARRTGMVFRLHSSAPGSVYIVPMQLLHVVTPCDQYHAGHTNEQTVLHDSRHITELAGK